MAKAKARKHSGEQVHLIRTIAMYHAYYCEALEIDNNSPAWEAWKYLRNEKLRELGLTVEQIEHF